MCVSAVVIRWLKRGMVHIPLPMVFVCRCLLLRDARIDGWLRMDGLWLGHSVYVSFEMVAFAKIVDDEEN